jgi:beta-xylosidase
MNRAATWLRNRIGPALLAAAAWPASAADPAVANVGEPVRDAAVCRAPDGAYYLTGTTALRRGERLDFDNNRGARVWKSADLQTWEDLGFVWDLWKDPSSNAHDHRGSAWQTELYPVPGLPPGARARGMAAPRLAHDGARFWLTFSMNGYAAGAMPGTADVKGPYVDTRLLAEAGAAPTDKSDASLFVDADGTRYLVWGGGGIAKLKSPDELAKVEMNQVGIEGPVRWLPAMIEGFPGDDGLPEHGAPYGVSVFLDSGRYHFLFSATTLRDGAVHEDAFVSTASALFGPYSRPQALALDAGRCTVFPGPDGALRVAYSTPDAAPTIAPFAPTKPAVAPGPKAARAQTATAVPPRPVRERPKDVPQLLDTIEPLFDHPLRDAALCRGPDGTWYLTGTEATRAADGTLDFSNNPGIRLWSSSDRKNWKDLGYVWTFADGEPAHLDLTCGAEPRIGRAVTAPELHGIKGAFWLVFSANGQEIRLLKSTTGKAEGPYADAGLRVRGRDPSLFEDSDGATHLVWGQGFSAKLTDDLSGLDGPVKTLFTNVAWYPRYLRRAENMGLWGSRIVKSGDWYVWTFTTRTGRCGINAIDTMASWSKSLDGPWGEPCLMLANGGQSTLVSDGEGGWLATVSGEDEYSQCPFQAAITPVVSGGAKGKPLALQAFNAKSTTTSFQAVNSLQATALDLWIGHPDLIPCTLRDVCLMRDKDGAYYCTGSFWGVDEYRRDVVMFRSEDLRHWKPLPPVYSYAKLKDDGLIAEADLAAFRDLIAGDAEGKNWRKRIQVGEQKVWVLDGQYYMNAQMFCSPGGHLLLKSASGTIAGPYAPLHWIVGVADLMQDDDGSVWFNGSGSQNRRFASAAEFLSTDQQGFQRVSPIPIESEEPWRRNLCFSEDCEAGIMKIGGKYVTWSTDWTGCYDAIYRYADRPAGPYRGDMRILPYGGNGRFFQTTDGAWFYAYFPNSNDYATRAQNFCRMNLYPLFVGEEGGELIVEPKALRENRARLETMGARWQGARPR